VLGIDPGSLSTGYGVVLKGGGGSLTHLCHGVVRLDQGSALSERLLAISEAIKGVIEEFRPDAAAIETIFFGKNVRSAVTLGHARGASMLSAASFGLEVFEYDPRTIKQAVTGYGNATKDQVQRMVKALLKTPDIARPDAADALATAICHINHFRKGVSSGRRRGIRTPASRG
jgi:crossover junction endodeoxyribonuclease RuvC